MSNIPDPSVGAKRAWSALARFRGLPLTATVIALIPGMLTDAPVARQCVVEVLRPYVDEVVDDARAVSLSVAVACVLVEAEVEVKDPVTVPQAVPA